MRIDKTYTTRVLEYIIKGVSRVLLREGQINTGEKDVFQATKNFYFQLVKGRIEKGIIDCPQPDQLRASLTRRTIPLTDRWACP